MNAPPVSRAVNLRGAAAKCGTFACRDDVKALKELNRLIMMRREAFIMGRHAMLLCCSIVLGFVLAASAQSPPPDRHPPPGECCNLLQS